MSGPDIKVWLDNGDGNLVIDILDPSLNYQKIISLKELYKNWEENYKCTIEIDPTSRREMLSMAKSDIRHLKKMVEKMEKAILKF